MILLICWQNVFPALSLIVMSSWNKQFHTVWFISVTHICQWWWSVFLPCFSSAAEKATTVPSIPFLLVVFFLTSHCSMHSIRICMTFWNSREHAPRWFSLMSFHKTKSAKQSASEHCNEEVSCADIVHLKRNIHVSKDLTVLCSTGKLFLFWINFISLTCKGKIN